MTEKQVHVAIERLSESQDPYAEARNSLSPIADVEKVIGGRELVCRSAWIWWE